MENFLIEKIHDEYMGFMVSFAIDRVVMEILESRERGEKELGLGLGLRETKKGAMFKYVVDIHMINEDMEKKVFIQSIPLTCKTDEEAEERAVSIVDAIGSIVKKELSQLDEAVNTRVERVFGKKPKVAKNKDNVTSINRDKEAGSKLH